MPAPTLPTPVPSEDPKSKKRDETTNDKQKNGMDSEKADEGEELVRIQPLCSSKYKYLLLLTLSQKRINN